MSAERPSLPSGFDRRNLVQIGVAVREHGLPSLPEKLSRDLAIPMAYWTAEQCAVVLVLCYPNHRNSPQPLAMELVYSRGTDGWVTQGPYFAANFSYDPIADPNRVRDLHGAHLVCGGSSHVDQPPPGQPGLILTGRASRNVKQGSREDRRRLESHFGAWVVCTDWSGPVEIAGYGEDGEVLDRCTVDGRER